MKKNLLWSVFLSILTMLSLLAGCTSNSKIDDISSFSVELKGKPGPENIDIIVKTSAKGVIELAYQIDVEPFNYARPAVLFSAGTKIEAKNGDVISISRDIVSNSQNYAIFAAKYNNQYSDFIKIDFVTPDFTLTEPVTILDKYKDGYKVRFTLPQSAKDAKNAFRYQFGNLPMYNKVTKLLGSNDVDMLLTNGGAHTRYITDDKTFVIDPSTQGEFDENGDPVLDDEGAQVVFHSPYVPGEPAVVMAGEFAWANADEELDAYGGWGEGYFKAMHDGSKWTGAFQRKFFDIVDPQPLPETSGVNIEVSNITPIDATVTFYPTDDVRKYFYCILDDATYNAAIELLTFDEKMKADVEGKVKTPEEYLKWFLTSEFAFFELGITDNEGPGYIQAASKFTEPLQGNTRYRILCTYFGDDFGHTQGFTQTEFTTNRKVLEAPKIVVTALKNDDPFSAHFNIKAPNHDVVGCYYGANYVREWMLAMGPNNNYPSLIKGGNAFTAEDVAKINSAEGLNVDFPTLDGETTRLAVYGFNEEYTFNKLDRHDDNCTAVADYKAPFAPGKTPVESAYFESLVGDWTAKATINQWIFPENDNEEGFYQKIDHTSHLIITKGAPAFPELTAKDYDIYTNPNFADGKPKPADQVMTKGQVDAMYQELKDAAELFTEQRLTNKNRLLVQGFIDFDYKNEGNKNNPGRLDYFSPYQLFTSPLYQSYDVSQIMYDFGPKWYLEVLEDGSVIAPFDVNTNLPMSKWGEEMHLGGYSPETNLAFIESESKPGFPVKISADNNTITIQGLEASLDNKTAMHYPNAILFNPMTGGVTIIASIISEIVLTRGWNGGAALSSLPFKYDVRSASQNRPSVKAPLRTFEGQPSELPSSACVKSMTKLQERVKALDDAHIVTEEMLDKKMNDYILKKTGLDLSKY